MLDSRLHCEIYQKHNCFYTISVCVTWSILSKLDALQLLFQIHDARELFQINADDLYIVLLYTMQIIIWP